LMRPAGVTVWREIEEALTREIADGVHPAGAKLPIERDLAAKFGVNRHTVRRALSSLQDKGLISIEPGRGMFAKSNRLSYPVGKRTRFSENVGHLSKYVKGQLLNTWHLAAPEKIAADLDVEIGATLVAIDDLRVLDSEPITLTTHYFPLPRFADLPVIFAETGSITKSLHELGVKDYTRRLTRCRPCRPARWAFGTRQRLAHHGADGAAGRHRFRDLLRRQPLERSVLAHHRSSRRTFDAAVTGHHSVPER
jgi:GntR family phosphonate transport system transcriptional regulator